MSDAVEMAQRHGRILARLSELGLTLAERVHDQALAADDPKTCADLGLAFHRIARTVRQTIALEARLVRDARRAELEEREYGADPIEAPPRDERRIARRKQEIREAVQRAIREEVEPEDQEHADYLTDLVEQRLELFGGSNGFGLEPLEQHIARFYEDFGLTGPEPEDEDDGEEIEFDAAGPPPGAWPPPPDPPAAAPSG